MSIPAPSPSLLCGTSDNMYMGLIPEFSCCFGSSADYKVGMSLPVSSNTTVLLFECKSLNNTGFQVIPDTLRPFLSNE